MLADVALDEPAGETVIALAGGGIEHHSASAVRRPGPPTLLGPYRQLVPCAPVSQPPCAIARGQLGQGKDPDLGEKIGLLEESVFDAEFCIAEARGPSLAGLSTTPPPPYVVQGPQLFWAHTGSWYHVRPFPSPRAPSPVASSARGKIPIWGRKSVSSRNRYLTPSSVSPKPEAHPSPGDEALATGATM